MQHMAWLVAGVLLGCGSLVQGTNRYVSLTGSGTSFYTNWAIAATNIQDAVDVSGTGDIIYITNGTYTLLNQVDTGTKAITLEGFNGSSNTFINGNYPQTTNRCFYVNNAAAIISGLTISNGYAATNSITGLEPIGDGGGLYVNAGLIRNCVISSNTAEYKGGGVYLADSTAIITNSTITRNYNGPAGAYGGGGVYSAGASKVQNCTLSFNFSTNAGGGVLMISGNGVIENCVFSNNIAGANGGGIASAAGTTIRNCVIVQNQVGGTGDNGGGGIRVDGSWTIENCLIMNNTSGAVGGGLWTYGDAGVMRNCTIVSNSAAVSGGGLWVYWQSQKVINTIIYSNTAPASPNCYENAAVFTNCCTTPLPTLGTGNITNNPQLADWTNNNYRLTANSPCLNRGINQDWMTNAVDLDGRRRVDRLNGRVDIGAYEFINKITLISGH